jgi:putative ABC transport system ATP-binding protein
MLMRLAGQRIVGRLRERTYAAALRQEVEFVEKGEGDVISRLSVDTSIVGERWANLCQRQWYRRHSFTSA